MAKIDFLSYNHQKILLFILIFHILLQINLISCDGCKNVHNITIKSCYNDVITFNHSKWRSGHACTNNNGDLIIEFSLNPGESSGRLFYGLNKNGRYYFPNEPVFKQIDYMTCQDCDNNNYRGRFEARNLFVSLSTDSTKQKQYLFSMSTYYSLAELIDIESDDFTYYAWNMTKFFGLSRPIFSYEYSLFEIENTNTYVTAFIESAGFSWNAEKKKDEEYSDTVTLKKFTLKNFGTSDYKEVTQITEISDTYDGRVVSAFPLKDAGLIVLIFIKKNTDKWDYTAYFYDSSDTKKGDCSIYGGANNLWVGFGLFIKGIWVKGDYAALAFFSDGQNKRSFVFKFVKYNGNYNFDYFYEIYINSDSNYPEFRQDVNANGLYRLSDDRVILFTTQDCYSVDYGCLNMYIFDFYNNYEKLRYRRYLFHHPGKRFAKEMEGSIYNGYTVFSATLSDSSEEDTFAIIMIFGFANGTDHTIDISPYLMDTGNYSESNNLYDYLISRLTIDNNIFGYEKIEKIRLISICDELLLYKGKYRVSQEESVLPLNELFDANHTLLQNKNIKKQEDALYMLEYQFLVKEPSYSTFYSTAIEYQTVNKKDTNPDYSCELYYNPQTLNGRVNKLYFKLCHRYCIECMEYGNNDNDQRCVNCKDEYTYDYLAYTKNFTGNCVPKDYLYDKESKKLKLCNTTSYKYYYNLTRDKERYCFKYDYECPDVYHYHNETSNECIDYTPPIPTTIPIIPTTIPAIQTTIIIPPTTVIIPPTTIITPPTTVIIPPSTIIIPPTTVITPPTTIITPPTTVIIPPTTIITPPTTIITPPTTQITPPTTIIYPPTTIITPPTTVITPPTTIITPPTTVINPPTTIITPPTTVIKPIPTILPKIISTLPIIPPPTTLPEIPPTVIHEQCKYGIQINYTNSFSNLTNEDIYYLTREKILSSYCLNGSSVLIAGSQGYAFQVSNTNNEMKSVENGNDISMDMTECENILKDVYHIDKELSLLIIKFLKNDGNGESQTFQYEIFHPITYEKLNLSYCDNTTIDVYVPFELSEEQEEIYNDIVDQGYNPLDINDKFYREICTPYTSENGTDVLLDDREEFIYTSLVNATICPRGCDYSEYYANKKYIKCECGTNNSEIVTLDLEHITGNNVYKSFLSTMKSTNYKVMICYNLVFNFKIFCHNYGSIISLVLFSIYFFYIIYYCYKEISPIKISISKLLFEEQNRENLGNSTPHTRNTGRKKSKAKIKEKADPKDNNPPKKGKIRKSKDANHLVTEDIDFIEAPQQNKVKRRKSTRRQTKPSTQKLMNNEIKSEATAIKSKKIEVAKVNEKKDDDKDKNKRKYLDNYELNNLEYAEACELDKRSYCQTYKSVIMREHLILSTFFNCKDYNLFYVKLQKFLVLFCTDMTMNGLFFIHESMHKKYTQGEDFTFVQKLPQLLFTLIVAKILETILCYLSLTDTHVYEIKSLPNDKDKGEKILDILECIKRKIVAFFSVTFILFLFYWYFISAFCAVYQNTQSIFIRDSLISFLYSLIEPFFIYAFTTILRYISLTVCCKRICCAGCLYKLSDIIPIF